MNTTYGQLHDHGARAASRCVYEALAEHFYYILFRDGAIELPFLRDDFAADSKRQRADLPRNPGDAIEKAPQRMGPPEAIVRTQPPGKEWVIERWWKSMYAFRLLPINRILRNPQLAAITIPDATPEIASAYALSGKQALLAKVRYNRPLDILLGAAASAISEGFTIRLPPLILSASDWAVREMLGPYNGRSIKEPRRFVPCVERLQWHSALVFKR
jgi:hypothetical protein